MAENSIIRSESRKMYNEGKTIISLLSNRYAGMPFDELTDSFEAVAAFQGSRIMLIATDGRVITAAGVGVALEFGFALVTALKGAAAADEIRRAVLAD
jgi:transcriptional regulator GlxA family with amidase domain